MKLTRRAFLDSAAVVAAFASVLPGAWAQTYPVRPVRIISGFPPGGINDTYARLIGAWLSENLGQQFIVENRSGAGGTLAAEAVTKSAPDGYTLLLTTSADAWNAIVLVVHPSVPVKTVPELIAYASANPGKVTVASAGIGSAPHMYWELFKNVTGIDMVHVPYRGGGPAVTDLLGGQVQVYFGTFPSTIQSIRADKLRALAVTSAKRAAVLPDVPAIAEFLPGYEASIYVGIAAPRSTPPDIVEKLNKTINLAFADAMITQRIADLGDTPLSLSSSEFAKLVVEETKKWGKVIVAENIKAE